MVHTVLARVQPGAIRFPPAPVPETRRLLLLAAAALSVAAVLAYFVLAAPIAASVLLGLGVLLAVVGLLQRRTAQMPVAVAAGAVPLPNAEQARLQRVLEDEVLPKYVEPFPNLNPQRQGQSRAPAALLPQPNERLGNSDYATYLRNCDNRVIDPRGQHGARHAARVAILSQVFWRLGTAFDANGERQLAGDPPPEQMVVGAAFHDAGRQAEGKDFWDADSAKLFVSWLQTRLDRQLDVSGQRNWLANKDPRDGRYNGLEHMSIHDADCLEIVRFGGPRSNFRWHNLALWNKPYATPLEQQTIRTTIRRLKDEWADFIDFVEDRISQSAHINREVLQNPATAYRRYMDILRQQVVAPIKRWPTLCDLLEPELSGP